LNLIADEAFWSGEWKVLEKFAESWSVEQKFLNEWWRQNGERGEKREGNLNFK
jgi:hypothetical protein